MSEQPSVGNIPPWELPDRMRRALRHAGMGPGQMADYLEVGRNTVSTWINGRIEPSPQTLRLWALRCGVPYAWLRYGDEPEHSPSAPTRTTRQYHHALATVSDIPRATRFQEAA